MNPAAITERDSAILSCQAPSSVTASECVFRIVRGGTVKASSCLKTLTGTELLRMTRQSSPAEIKVLCFYTAKLGKINSQSPLSIMSSIIVHSE